MNGQNRRIIFNIVRFSSLTPMMNIVFRGSHGNLPSDRSVGNANCLIGHQYIRIVAVGFRILSNLDESVN